jgi:hypothetical protein
MNKQPILFTVTAKQMFDTFGSCVLDMLWDCPDYSKNIEALKVIASSQVDKIVQLLRDGLTPCVMPPEVFDLIEANSDNLDNMSFVLVTKHQVEVQVPSKVLMW